MTFDIGKSNFVFVCLQAIYWFKPNN